MMPVAERTEPLNPLKLFSHITSGLLDPGNALVLSTARLLEYVSEEKIKSIVLRYQPHVAIRELERLLAEVPSYVGFSAVVVKFTTDRDDLSSRTRPCTQKTRNGRATNHLYRGTTANRDTPVADTHHPFRTRRSLDRQNDHTDHPRFAQPCCQTG